MSFENEYYEDMPDLLAVSEDFDDLADESERLEDESMQLESVEDAEYTALSMDDDAGVEIFADMLAGDDEEVSLLGRRGRRGVNQAKLAIRTVGAVKYDGGGKTTASKLIPMVRMNTEKSLKLADETDTAIREALKDLTSAQKKLRTRVERLVAARAKAPQAKVTLVSELRPLAMQLRSPQSEAEIISNATQTIKIANAVTKEWTKQVGKLGEKLAKSATKFDMNYPEKTLDDFNGAMASLRINDMVKLMFAKNFNDRRFRGRYAQATDEMPGNTRLVIVRASETADDVKDDAVSRSKYYRNLRIRAIKSVNRRRARTDAKVTMTVMEADRLLALMDMSEKIIEVITEIENNGTFRENIRRSKDIKSKLDKHYFGSRKLNPRYVREYNAVYQYVGAYQRWATQPMTSMVARLLGYVRAINALVSRHAAAY